MKRTPREMSAVIFKTIVRVRKEVGNLRKEMHEKNPELGKKFNIKDHSELIKAICKEEKVNVQCIKTVGGWL